MALSPSGFAIIQFANALKKRFCETEKRLMWTRSVLFYIYQFRVEWVGRGCYANS